jgi:hypothetical protein
VSIGLARAQQTDLSKLLSPKGQTIVDDVSKGCLNPTAYPGLKFEDMLKPQYQDWKKVPALVESFNASIMGRTGTPDAPLLMAVGNKDGTGDGVMIAKDVQELAHTYCGRGVSVQLHEYQGVDHIGAAGRFEPEAIAFLQQRFAGQAPSSDCAGIGAGNSLDPLPTPATSSPKPRAALELSRLRRSGGGYSVALRAVSLKVKSARVSVYRIKTSGRRVLVARTTIRGVIRSRGRRMRLPLPNPVKGTRYIVIARGTAGAGKVRGSLEFRAR